MRVRAKFVSDKGREGRVVGYYGEKRIREGEIFTLVPRKMVDGKILSAEQQFSKKWMEEVDRMPVRRTQPERTPGPVIPKAGQLPPPSNDPLGGDDDLENQNENEDPDLKQPGSDEPSDQQPGGSNSDVI